jgi:crotonobetainyl-CoA:carnitine CoA-transferase CaiB-like acyl-CoA transferase
MRFVSSEPTPRRAPLAGIRVVDFTRVLAGPYATMMMADFGADVIKIESTVGDETRAWAPPRAADGLSTYFLGVNRNKRSLVLDLNDPAHYAQALTLVSTADVVIENFRPGVMAKFGLDIDSVADMKPDIVYCSLTGFGAGAGKDLAGYDLLIQAMGGLMSITGSPEGEPTKAGVALVDVISGLNAFSGVLLALRNRDAAAANGEPPTPQRIEIDLLTSLLAALSNQSSAVLNTGVDPTRMGNAHPSIAPYELYRAADRPLVIAVGSDRHFALLAKTLGKADLATDARFATNADRVAHRDALKAELEGLLATRSAAEWVDDLAGAGLPVGPVNSISDAFELARRLGLEPTVSLERDGEAVRSAANPIHLPESPAQYVLPPPHLGEHSEANWKEEN